MTALVNNFNVMQITALPPPDAEESAALQQELLAMEAVLEDLRQRLQAEGYDISDLRQQPLASPNTAFMPLPTTQQCPVDQNSTIDAQTAKHALPSALPASMADNPDGISAEQAQTSMHSKFAQGAEMALPSGTDRSLAEIDAVMQARGYRYSYG